MNPPTSRRAQAPSTDTNFDLYRGGLQTPWGFIARSFAIIALTVCPAIICAYLAQTSSNWHVFERSGSIVTIIGLLLASRRYIEHTVTDLVTKDIELKLDKGLSEVVAARCGLTLSAFGTLIWGWGIFLRWWSFGVLALWAAFLIYRAFHDPILQRRGAGAVAGFDTDGDGSVSNAEFLDGLSNASKDQSSGSAQSLLGLMDTDGSGSVSSSEFSAFEGTFVKPETVET